MSEHETESRNARLNRHFSELLQEIRVAQTGVQILFAFLLTLPFSSRFDHATDLQRWIYIAILLSTTAASGLLIGPVAYHRLTSGRQMRAQLLEAANHLALGGIGALLLALAGSILLVTDVVLGGAWASVLTGFSVIWLAGLWYVLPLARRRSLTNGGRGTGR